MENAVITALQSTAGEIIGVIEGIGPVALGVAGTFLVWRMGLKFFKSISK